MIKDVASNLPFIGVENKYNDKREYYTYKFCSSSFINFPASAWMPPKLQVKYPDRPGTADEHWI